MLEDLEQTEVDRLQREVRARRSRTSQLVVVLGQVQIREKRILLGLVGLDRPGRLFSVGVRLERRPVRATRTTR
jgi:hypothetical protein